jgi:threonine dehydrogenase-like Zn-dependent dehydrogenase
MPGPDVIYRGEDPSRARANMVRFAPGARTAWHSHGLGQTLYIVAVIAVKELGATRIIAMSRHEPRQKLAREFGATDIVAERGEEGVARVKELTGGIGADAVLECVGNPDAMRQALHSTRPGGNVGFVGVPHAVKIDGEELFFSHVALRGGPAPVRAFLPDLIQRVLTGRIDPGKLFELELPLEQAAEGYQAMDERRAIKSLLRP